MFENTEAEETRTAAISGVILKFRLDAFGDMPWRAGIGILILHARVKVVYAPFFPQAENLLRRTAVQ